MQPFIIVQELYLSIVKFQKCMRTILLLFASNVFMTYAWYGSLKYPNLATWKAVLISWSIAFFEYSLMIPANRGGYLSGMFTASQLKIAQEAITLTVFVLFSVFYLKESRLIFIIFYSQ